VESNFNIYISGGTTVTISGYNFGRIQGAGKISFDGMETIVSDWSDTLITCLSPAHAEETVDLLITTDRGQTVILEDGFNYIDSAIITNAPGATHITTNSARLNGKLKNNDNDDHLLHIYWGKNDGGTTADDWDYNETPSLIEGGSFYVNINNLTSNTKYYYRSFVEGIDGGSWADSTTSFTTQNLPPAVNLTKPGDSDTFTAPATITLSAEASDIDGIIIRVAFYDC